MIEHTVKMPDGRVVKWQEIEEATLQLRGNVKVTAKRTQYTAEAFERRAHYGERRDVRDGAPSREVCKENGWDCDAEALKFGNAILQGYYSGDIVERQSMDPEVRFFRDSVYAALKEHGLSEAKIGTLGTTKESVHNAGQKAGIHVDSLHELWVASEDTAELLKASRKIKVKINLKK
jgi:hypothetical protein